MRSSATPVRAPRFHPRPRAARPTTLPIQSAPPRVIDRMRTVRVSSLTSNAMTPFPALGMARIPGEISSRLVPRQGFSPKTSASASRAAIFLATGRGVVNSSRKAAMRAMSRSTSGCRTTLNRIIAAARCQHPFEDPREIPRGVFHELLVRSFRPAADLFRHRLQHGFAFGLFVPKPLNTRGDHGAHRREFASLHHRLGESVVFVDEGDGGFDGHAATVSRSHTIINTGRGFAGISTSVTVRRLRRTGAGRGADQQPRRCLRNGHQPRNHAGNASVRTRRATLRREAGHHVMRRITRSTYIKTPPVNSPNHPLSVAPPPRTVLLHGATRGETEAGVIPIHALGP